MVFCCFVNKAFYHKMINPFYDSILGYFIRSNSPEDFLSDCSHSHIDRFTRNNKGTFCIRGKIAEDRTNHGWIQDFLGGREGWEGADSDATHFCLLNRIH